MNFTWLCLTPISSNYWFIFGINSLYLYSTLNHKFFKAIW